MSAINVIVNEPVIPFIRKKEDKDIRKIRLERNVQLQVNVGGVVQPFREKRTAELIIIDDDDIETLLRLILSFVEACRADSLGLENAPGQMYTEFRKCLNNIVLDTYDGLVANIQVRDQAHFLGLVNDLVGEFCNPTAYADQKRYMDTFKKPYKITVKELGNRLIIVNKYTAYLPGSNAIPVYDENTIKYAFYNMMLPNWQLAFAGSSHFELSDNNYSFHQLSRFMQTQETIQNRRSSSSNSNNNQRRGNFGRRNNRQNNFRPYPAYPGYGRNAYRGNFQYQFGRGGNQQQQPQPQFQPSAFPQQTYRVPRAPAGGRYGGRYGGRAGGRGNAGGRGYAGYGRAYYQQQAPVPRQPAHVFYAGEDGTIFDPPAQQNEAASQDLYYVDPLQYEAQYDGHYQEAETYSTELVIPGTDSNNVYDLIGRDESGNGDY